MFTLQCRLARRLPGRLSVRPAQMLCGMIACSCTAPCTAWVLKGSLLLQEFFQLLIDQLLSPDFGM